MTHVSPLSKHACLSAAAAAAWTNRTLIIDQNQWEADRESIGWRLLRSGTTARHDGSDLDLQRGRGARLWNWDGRFQSDYLASSAAGGASLRLTDSSETKWRNLFCSQDVTSRQRVVEGWRPHHNVTDPKWHSHAAEIFCECLSGGSFNTESTDRTGLYTKYEKIQKCFLKRLDVIKPPFGGNHMTKKKTKGDFIFYEISSYHQHRTARGFINSFSL